MDTITHGIAGALIGKAFFAPESTPGGPEDPAIKTLGRTAILGATLGSVFPDSDSFLELFSHNDLAIIETHRYITHSFVCLPAFAIVVALVVLAFARWRKWRAPSFLALTGICAAGIASHIVFDLITSFGTMIWSPWKDTRAAWDLVFIIDFTMTAIVLVPQVLAWTYRAQGSVSSGSRRRSVAMWILFSIVAELAVWMARVAEYPYPGWVAFAAPAVLAALFFLPWWNDWGFRVGRAKWCRAGVLAVVAYLLLCFGAHRMALDEVEHFAAEKGVPVQVLGALPLAPTANHWTGLIRTPHGVYRAQFALFEGLRRAPAPEFRFLADSVPNGWIEAARQLPQVKAYLAFARFPLFRYSARDRENVVEISDMQFSRRGQARGTFTLGVTFDGEGRVLRVGWMRPR